MWWRALTPWILRLKDIPRSETTHGETINISNIMWNLLFLLAGSFCWSSLDFVPSSMTRRLTGTSTAATTSMSGPGPPLEMLQTPGFCVKPQALISWSIKSLISTNSSVTGWATWGRLSWTNSGRFWRRNKDWGGRVWQEGSISALISSSQRSKKTSSLVWSSSWSGLRDPRKKNWSWRNVTHSSGDWYTRQPDNSTLTSSVSPLCRDQTVTGKY